jgi:diadenosine tetraphosphate (Ap4A) HIT family hydrolase
LGCPFCNRPSDLLDRVFYENNNLGWFAFLNAPPHTKGHLILAALGRHGHCPQDFDLQTLSGLGEALCEVVQAIRKFHGPGIKDVLLASLRGDVKHFHLHLLPLWPQEEKRWREVTGYRDSHLMEFLGSLEKKQDFLLAERALKECKSKEEVRLEAIKELSNEIQALRRITGYKLRAYQITSADGL